MASNTAPTPPPDDGDTSTPDTSYIAALHHGLFATVHGLGRTLTDIGLPTIGNAVSGAVSDASNYQPATTGLSRALSAGQYLDAAEYLPRLAVEHLPDVAGMALVGPEGAGDYMAARSLGENTDAEAALRGHSIATWGDVARALPLTSAESSEADEGYMPADIVLSNLWRAHLLSAAQRILGIGQDDGTTQSGADDGEDYQGSVQRMLDKAYRLLGY